MGGSRGWVKPALTVAALAAAYYTGGATLAATGAAGGAGAAGAVGGAGAAGAAAGGLAAGMSTSQLLGMSALASAGTNLVSSLLVDKPQMPQQQAQQTSVMQQTPPGANDAALGAAMDNSAQQQQARVNRGRTSTLLTGGQGSGIGATTSRTLLGA